MKGKTSLIFAIIFLSLCVVGIMAGLAFTIYDNYLAQMLCYFVGSLSGVIGFVLIISWGIKYLPSTKPIEPKVFTPKEDKVKTVDVKPAMSDEEKLYKQYQDLYKEGLITKEDLEKKKKELLENKSNY